VDVVTQERARSFGLTRERPVVISGNDQLVGVGQRANEVHGARELFQITPATQIAGVNEHIAFRNHELVVIQVRVRNGDQTRHRRTLTRMFRAL
jgi:hypothetical protein